MLCYQASKSCQLRPAHSLFSYSVVFISGFLADLLQVLKHLLIFFPSFIYLFFHLLIFVQWPNCTLLLLLASEETSPTFSVHAARRGLFPPSSLCIAGWPGQFQKEQAFWEILRTWGILSCMGKDAFEDHLLVFKGLFFVYSECWNTNQAWGRGGLAISRTISGSRCCFGTEMDNVPSSWIKHRRSQ